MGEEEDAVFNAQNPGATVHRQTQPAHTNPVQAGAADKVMVAATAARPVTIGFKRENIKLPFGRALEQHDGSFITTIRRA